MEIAILLDHDLEGFDDYFEAGLRETGWDQDLTFIFKRLRDYDLPDDHPDQEIWRFAQQQQLWLLTNNRNSDDDTSLQATIKRENTPDSLPVITVSDKNKLVLAKYRQQAVNGLVEIVISPERYCGTGRLFIP